jgi:hypothetical protein
MPADSGAHLCAQLRSTSLSGACRVGQVNPLSFNLCNSSMSAVAPQFETYGLQPVRLVMHQFEGYGLQPVRQLQLMNLGFSP